MIIDVNVQPNLLSIISLVISGFVAIGTISLAIVALFSMKKARNEYRNEQLDRIINWATDATESESDKELIVSAEGLSFNKEYTKEYSRKLFIYGHLRRILKQGDLMTMVAVRLKKESLQKAIEVLIAMANNRLTLFAKQLLTLLGNFTNPSITTSAEYLAADREIINEMKSLEHAAMKLTKLANELKK